MKLLYYIFYFLISFLVTTGDIVRQIVRTIYAIVRFFLSLVFRLLMVVLYPFGALYKSIYAQLHKKSIQTKAKKSPRRAYTPLKKRRKKRIFLSPIFKIKYFIIGFLTSFVLFVGFQTYSLLRSLPTPKNIGHVNYALSTHIYDRSGHPLYEIYHEQNRTPIKLDDVPAYVYQASVAIEDRDFFKHQGISLTTGVLRAVREMVVSRSVQGGSTITQQLVKSSLLSSERTLLRKVREMILALWTERLYTKKEILEMYLNQVPYGGSSYGIEEAAETFFGKHARDLDLDEAALLAGLPQSPSVNSPFINPEGARARRHDVLVRMAEQGYISQVEARQADVRPVSVLAPKTLIQAPHFVFYAKDQLLDTYGAHDVEEGGLRVYTTLDQEIQKKAEEIVSSEIEKIRYLNVSNGAMLVTRPLTGEILAMVGSTNYFATPSGAFNVTSALRQPGSSIKPLLYTLGLAKGMTAATMIDDVPTNFAIPGAPAYQPVNYDGRFHGRVTVRTSLANSYNIPAVKTLQSVGVQSFIEFARRIGISTWPDDNQFGLSLALGGGEVTMLDMARSYGTIAAMGQNHALTPFMKIMDSSGQVLYDGGPEPSQEVSSAYTYIIADIMSDNAARVAAFGPHSALEIPGYKVAVKTGTTDSKKDNWTIGFTPEYLVAVWVGNNDNTPMNPQLVSGITGAAPIWNKMMTYLLTAHSNKNTWYKRPDDVIEVPCYGPGSREVFVRGTESRFCRPVTISPSPQP